MSEPEMPRETAKALAAYAEYCALGRERSLAKLAKRFGDSSAKIESLTRQYEVWSSKYGWQERVKQYDRERAEEKRLEREVAAELMNERHAREACEDQELARKVLKAGAEQKRPYVSMAAVQWLKNSREDERKARGVEELAENQRADIEINAHGEAVQVVVYYPQLDPAEDAEEPRTVSEEEAE